MYFRWYYFLNKLIITGIRFHPSGDGNRAVLCILCREADGVEIARTTTDKDGRYTFTFDDDFLPFDKYVVKFYGEGKFGIVEEEDWERFELLDIKSLPLVFLAGTPNLEVSEVASKQKIDVNNDERTYISLDFTNLEESQGILSKIIVYYKKQ